MTSTSTSKQADEIYANITPEKKMKNELKFKIKEKVERSTITSDKIYHNKLIVANGQII